MVFDHLLDPVYQIPDCQTGNRVISFHRSPDRRWIVIQSGYRIEVDLWLYNTRTKGRPVRIASQPGNHTAVKWHGTDVFEINWGDTGYDTSQLFRVGNTESGKRVDGMLLYEPRCDVYVSLMIDDSLAAIIEVGRVFSEKKPELELFKLDLEYDHVADAWFAINDTRIIGNKVVVYHTRMNGEEVETVFSSRLVQ